MLPTLERLTETRFPAIQRGKLTTLQINLGYLCNQQCLHCHVNAGPKRTELMEQETINTVFEFIDAHSIEVLDLTGGAPEMNPHFFDLVRHARQRGLRVLNRCNLTILEEPGYEHLASFLAEQNVEIVASMPCYQKENVDSQRGKGVYDASIAGLRQLNALGYAQPDSDLVLNLVFNPQGPSLPPAQAELERDYRRIFANDFNIQFNTLFTLANMPIKRFGSMLISTGQFEDYMQLLHTAHKPENVSAVMCRSLLSVDWRGYVYDCDFNQMLDLPINSTNSSRPHLQDLLNTELQGVPITIADHCYGCTAGQGSSCGGALS